MKANAQVNAGLNEFKPDPDGPPIPRAQLLRLMAVWREDADRLIAQADPRTGKKVGRPPLSESARVQELMRMLEASEDAKERAEHLARARALLTARRDLLDLMR